MSTINLEITAKDPERTWLCTAYWQLDELQKFTVKVRDISDKYGIKVSEVVEMANRHSTARSTKILCTVCSTPYIFKSRADFTQQMSGRYGLWTCASCIGREREQSQEREGREVAIRKAVIADEFSSDKFKPIKLSDITLYDAICLVSMIRLGANEDLTYINPISTFGESLSPGGDDQANAEIARGLYKRGVLLPHSATPVNGFKWNGRSIESIFLLQVYWAWPSTDDPQYIPSLRLVSAVLESIFRTKNWPELWNKDLILVYRDIVLKEALAHLKMCMEEHHFNFHPGEKSIQVLQEVLEVFSLGQSFNIIWRAARDAAAYSVRAQVPRYVAANSVVGTIQRYAQRATAEGYSLKPYRRDRRCAQSMVSQTFFDSVLQIGDQYIEKLPSILAPKTTATPTPTPTSTPTPTPGEAKQET